MAKSAVNDIISDVKVLGDYNIVDTDLDSLLLIAVNFALKQMKQLFLDKGMLYEIGESDNFVTVADTPYIELLTTTPDFDENIKLTERTNDKPIPIIPYSELISIYTDPTANQSETPDVAAFYNDRLYLGPTPSSSGVTLYLDYIPLITKIVAGGTLPFKDKYDEIVVSISNEYLVKFQDKNNRSAIKTAEENTSKVVKRLITGAATNIGMIQQSQSRRQEVPYFSPRKVIT